MINREAIESAMQENASFTLRADGKTYRVRGSDYIHFHPEADLVVVFGERGKVYLVPLQHISELAYQDEDLAE